MRPSHLRLVDEVAGAVADGDYIDWAEAHRRSDDAAVAKTVSNLELIDVLGRSSRSSTSVSKARPRVRPFLLVLIPLVGLQVVVASIGFAMGAAGTTTAPGWLLLASTLVFGAAGIIVAIAGRWDPRTAPLAGLFLVIASSTSLPLLALVSSGEPGTIGWWLGAFVLEAFFPFFLWRFVGRFPRVVRLEREGRWISWATGASLGVGAVLFVLNTLDRLRLGDGAIGEAVPFLLRGPTSGYWFLLLGLALPAPAVVFARLRHSSDDERRRANLFVWGLAAGILPMLIAVLAEVIFPSWSVFMNIPRNRMIGSFVVYGFMLTIPLTLGYAAVSRQVLDLRFVIGRAARAALARKTLWSLSTAPWFALALILWVNRERSLSELFRSPAVPVLVATGLMGITLILSRERILAGIEGALLGPHRSPSAALASLAQRLSGVRSNIELAQTINSHAAALLFAESSYLLIRSKAEGVYLSPNPRCRPLDLDSALAHLAESSPGPISTDVRDFDSWLPLLPESDRQWTADADIRLVLPVVDRSEETTALIAFGPSRSGWSHDDVRRDTASAIASAVSLALARLGSENVGGLSPTGNATDEPAAECLQCGKVSQNSTEECACGETLSPAAIPYSLAGKFKLERVLGRGGMGVVYLATDLTLDRKVALKTLPRMRSGSLLRLRGEARSMASFVHPHLALIFGAETWRGVPVLVVEYLPGGTLSRRISQTNHPAFVIELGIKLAGALAALHDKEMLHRDVKPANIGFSEKVEPKLLDFGLARIVQESQADIGRGLDIGSALGHDRSGARLTRTDHVVGTPLYLSPEVLQGAPPSPQQDLWGLHVVLWETLAGRHPLHDLSQDVALTRISDGEIPSVSIERPDLPQNLVDLLDRGLGRRLASRPKTAKILQRDLELVLRSMD